MSARNSCATMFLAATLFGLAAFASAQEPAAARQFDPASPEPTEYTGITITKRVDAVNVVFTVTDGRGRFISNLPQSSFEVLDNHKAPQTVEYFEQQTNLPLRVALLVDLSDSIRGRFKFEQDAASSFLKRVLRPDKDEAFVLGFDQHVHLIQEATGDQKKLSNSIHKMTPGGATALYDAIIRSSNKLRNMTSGTVTRKAIILISDGMDTASKASLNEAIQATERAEAIVYVISTNDLQEAKHPKGDEIMDLIARPTGGHILKGAENADLKYAFGKIEEALRSQYAMGYHPADFKQDGSFRSIEITADKPTFKVQCRHGYFAPRDLVAHYFY
ncbi:MAG TPA: VWA domain-containing protein [Terriglobales bacterium]|nr:VWA domain-containing protein [Terriglobales bacterium]